MTAALPRDEMSESPARPGQAATPEGRAHAGSRRPPAVGGPPDEGRESRGRPRSVACSSQPWGDRRGGVWSSLHREWRHHASGPDAYRKLVDWSAAAPILSGYDSPADVVEAIGLRGHPERSCALLAGLLVAAGGDTLAAYSVLVAIVPGMRAAARRRWISTSENLWATREELEADTLTSAWMAVCDHAGQHHPHPARVILRQVERQLRAAHQAHQRTSHREVELVSDAPLAADDLGQITEIAARRLVSAVRSGGLGPTVAAVGYRIAVAGDNLATAARRHGLNPGEARRLLRHVGDLLDGAPSGPGTGSSSQLQRQGVDAQAKEDFPMLPLLLNVNQAARLIGVGRSTVYRLIQAGDLFSVRRGASRRIPLWAVYDYVDRLCAGRYQRIPLPGVIDYLSRLEGTENGKLQPAAESSPNESRNQ